LKNWKKTKKKKMKYYQNFWKECLKFWNTILPLLNYKWVIFINFFFLSIFFSNFFWQIIWQGECKILEEKVFLKFWKPIIHWKPWIYVFKKKFIFLESFFHLFFKFWIARNGIPDEGAKAIFQALETNTTLTELDMSFLSIFL